MNIQDDKEAMAAIEKLKSLGVTPKQAADAMRPRKRGFVDDAGKFHCPCGATHERGAINGVDVFRCLRCGTSYKVRGVAQLR